MGMCVHVADKLNRHTRSKESELWVQAPQTWVMGDGYYERTFNSRILVYSQLNIGIEADLLPFY